MAPCPPSPAAGPLRKRQPAWRVGSGHLPPAGTQRAGGRHTGRGRWGHRLGSVGACPGDTDPTGKRPRSESSADPPRPHLRQGPDPKGPSTGQVPTSSHARQVAGPDTRGHGRRLMPSRGHAVDDGRGRHAPGPRGWRPRPSPTGPRTPGFSRLPVSSQCVGSLGSSTCGDCQILLLSEEMPSLSHDPGLMVTVPQGPGSTLPAALPLCPSTPPPLTSVAEKKESSEVRLSSSSARRCKEPSVRGSMRVRSGKSRKRRAEPRLRNHQAFWNARAQSDRHLIMGCLGPPIARLPCTEHIYARRFWAQRLKRQASFDVPVPLEVGTVSCGSGLLRGPADGHSAAPQGPRAPEPCSGRLCRTVWPCATALPSLTN